MASSKLEWKTVKWTLQFFMQKMSSTLGNVWYDPAMPGLTSGEPALLLHISSHHFYELMQNMRKYSGWPKKKQCICLCTSGCAFLMISRNWSGEIMAPLRTVFEDPFGMRNCQQYVVNKTSLRYLHKIKWYYCLLPFSLLSMLSFLHLNVCHLDQSSSGRLLW